MKSPHCLRSLVAATRAGALVACISLAASAQVAQRWTATEDLSQIGSGDSPWTMKVDPATNRLYVVGWYQTSLAGFGLYQAFASAYDLDGAHQWTRSFPTAPGRITSLYRAAVHPGGGIVAVGVDFHPGQSAADTLTVRIDAAGNVLWSRLWDGPAASLDDGEDVVVDPAGIAHVMTRTWSSAVADYQAALLRYDASGALLGATITSAPNEAAGLARISRLPGGDFVIVSPPRATRLTAAGATVWSNTVVSSFSGLPFVVPDGSIVLGSTGTPIAPANIGPFQVTRVDPSGNVAWVRTINDPVFVGGGANAIVVLPSGASVAAGFRTTDVCSPGGPVQEGLLVSHDAAGNTLWQHAGTFAGLAIQEFWQAQPATNGDVVLLGIERDPQGLATPHVLRVTPDGEVRLVVTPFGPLTSGHFAGQLGVGAADEMFMSLADSNVPFGPSDTLIARFDSTLVTYCLADGSGSACPCGNAAPVGTLGGCLNATGAPGQLVAEGNPSLASDTMQLATAGLGDTFALFFQGTSVTAGGAGSPFGDGLLCVGGTTIRLAIKPASGGLAQYPVSPEAPISQMGGTAAAGMRTYQAWYRSSESFCTQATFNLTNAVRATWVP